MLSCKITPKYILCQCCVYTIIFFEMTRTKCECEKMMFSTLVAVVLLFSSVNCLTDIQDCYCVKPHSELNCTKSNPCHYECYPLSYYFINKSLITDLPNDTTFYFLPGVHLLQEVFNCSSRNTILYNLSLIGIACNGLQNCVQSEPVATLQCNGTSSGFYFHGIHNLTITGISLISCGFIDETNYNIIASALLVKYVRNMHVCGVEINHARGWGLYCKEVTGESFIDYTNISGANYTTTHKGGNLRIKYFNHEVSRNDEYHNVTVKNSVISNGTARVQDESGYAGGIDIYLSTTERVNLIFVNVSVINNAGYDGGNIAITYTTLQSSWRSIINITSCHVIGGEAHTGAGLYIEMIWRHYPPQKQENNISNSSIALYVAKTMFFNNTAYGVGGGVYVQLHESIHLSARADIHFSECVFKNNSLKEGHSGAAVHVINFHLPGYMPHNLPEYKVTFDACIFKQNRVNTIFNSNGCGTLYIEDNALTVITNSNFSNNMCSGITAIRSSLILEGNIVICNNTAHNGGGMLLCASSVMKVSPNAHIVIESNYAFSFGGGIYAEFECAEAYPPCFYQADNSTAVFQAVHLVNNTAEQAGNTLYGGAIDGCYIYEDETNNNTSNELKSTALFAHLFKISPRNNSTISSNPYKVCFCNPERNYVHTECKQELNYTPHTYPGGTINLSAFVVGQRNGTVPGVVVAKLSGGNLTLGHLQKSQIINSTECTPLNYTVTGNISDENPDEKILLSVENADFRDVPGPRHNQSLIRFKIQPCPHGFQLINGKCDCLKILSENLKNISCDISNVAITREGSVSWWLGYDDRDDNLTFSQFCPFDFCTTKSKNLQLKNKKYDSQCAFKRSGVLCGQCQKELSIVFGTGKCKPCSKSVIVPVLLTLLFAILGIIIVFLLGFFQLNVSEGAMNPIIFYMNIVQLNLALFFHSHKHLSNTQYHVVYLLKVFVAWMNLDLGIEKCYYNGMDAIGKVALQFVFPIYLWILTGLIIYLSRRYSLIARMAGKSSVKLFATIILFSYAKIVRCIIDVLWASNIYHIANGTTSVVWKLDGSIEYFQRKHAILFAFAVLVAFCTLPYTLSLLCIQCLRKWSHMKILFWVVRLKPFFDAYTGPYRDRFHFWTGFLLIVRISLFSAIASNTTKGPILNITLINMTAAILLLFNLFRIYKTWQHTAIESFTYFNLIVLSTGTAYVESKIYSNFYFYCVFICVGSMFLLVFGVGAHNVYKKISATGRWDTMKVWLLEKDWPWMKRKRIRSLILPHAMIDSSSSSEEELDPLLQNAPPVAKYDCYREPLFETTAYS